MGVIPTDIGETYPASLKQMPPSPQESSQVGMANVSANITAHSSHSPSPTSATLEMTNAPTILLDYVLHLQEEMNDAMVQVLTIKATVDTLQQRLILYTEIALHKSEAKASETVKESQAHYP